MTATVLPMIFRFRISNIAISKIQLGAVLEIVLEKPEK
jgi:hypothetical protein